MPEREQLDAIRSLAMGTRYTVEQIESAWAHLRNIPGGITWHAFALFVHELSRLDNPSLVQTVQQIQRMLTGVVSRVQRLP